jgi:prevent-host-death family protein
VPACGTAENNVANCTKYCTIYAEVNVMDIIVPISEVRSKLPEYVKKISSLGKHLVITRNGKAAAVMISADELETLEVMADKKLLSSISRANDDIAQGRIHSHKDVFGNV